MQDRLPLYPGRVQMVPVPGQANTYDMVRADQPTQEGTPLNKSTLLSDETAQAMGLDPANDPTPDEALQRLNAKATSILTTATLLASGWADGVYTLAVNGVTATSNQEILPALGITEEQLEALQAANIQDGGQAVNSITLKAYGEAPTIDIPIRVIKRGD